MRQQDGLSGMICLVPDKVIHDPGGGAIRSILSKQSNLVRFERE
jgi:hypothetical protein